MGCTPFKLTCLATFLALLSGAANAQERSPAVENALQRAQSAEALRLRPKPPVVVATPASAQGVVYRDPYQGNPFAEYTGPREGECCNDCGDCFFWDPGVWVEADVLMWWRSGQSLPALVTSSGAGTPAQNSGVLPGATVLYGNEQAGGRMQTGGRIDAGLWFDTCNRYGFGGRYTSLGDESTIFTLDSTQNPIIARPFFDVTDQNGNIIGENSFLVAHPTGGPLGERTTGSISVSTTSTFESTDYFYRHNWRMDECMRLDVIAGYQTTAINEELIIDSSTTLVDTIRVVDRFQAHNRFNGGVLGINANRDFGCWDVNLLAKVAIGTTREQILIQGFRTPTPSNGNPNNGLLAIGSNSGIFTQHDFCVSPEVALKLGYHVSPNMTVTVGYSVMYWSTITRPGDQIDRVINPSQIDGALVGNEVRPTFRFQHDDFWVQGMNIGLRWDY